MNSLAEKWLGQLTLDEKISLVAGKDLWSTSAVDRLGIPSLNMNDGPHGVRKEQDGTLLGLSKPATCFPTSSGLASSWDIELMEQIGVTLGQECKQLDVQILLGPGINMKRSPLCGRNFEYYSEDPCLAGEMAAAFIIGVQSRNIGTSLKHFACYNTEFERMTISSEVDERTMREIYLAAFERAVKKAEPWSIMSSYNKINGTYASENRLLLTDILRGEWNFSGFVMSDWLAVNDRVKALQAGLDLEMPGPALSNGHKLKEAWQSGELAVETLDRAVLNVLSVVEKSLGSAGSAPDELDWSFEQAHRLARTAAEESMVLLKNDNRLLPLEPSSLPSIAIIGRNAKYPLIQGGGSSNINPSFLEIPFDEIVKMLDSGTQIIYADGYDEDGAVNQGLLSEAVRAALQAEVVLLFAGSAELEGNDRESMDLPAGHSALLQAVASIHKSCVVVLNNGSAVNMCGWISDASAVLEAWLPGQAGGSALARLLFGEANPSGKLAETFPVKLSDNPSYLNFPGDNGKTVYGEGLFIGYRYYDRKEIEPLFPFGYGLSYTSFDYTDLEVVRKPEEGSLAVSFKVTNTGSRCGKEIVQLYVSDPDCELVRPDRELKGFAKVELSPGETQTVTMQLEKRDFSYYHPAAGGWTADSGDFVLSIGASSRDIRLSMRVHIEFTGKTEITLDANSLLKQWLKTERGLQAVRYLAEHVAEDENLKETILAGKLRGFFLEMPLWRFIKLLSMDGTAERWSDRMMEELFGL
ncbi:beta-glucosidase [Paenibacillus forsythiae]|uniref:Beta-glucosidase n=1 Tax=Paenibacillus forsythiae TaxID=365616 RepID=A0ABU3HC65_9BACL|nr:glycoside hydrolase family 3 C-terminal domain-containing protein [Paenibacillus forsythiae]MDT3428413.1 beta-glucosidase [Paenibacillus forsythiae]